MLNKQVTRIGLMASLVILLHFPDLTGLFIRNSAWLYLTKAYLSLKEDKASALKALKIFPKAPSFDPQAGQKASLGTGMAYFVFGQEAAAFSSWQNGGVSPWLLIGPGNWFKAKHRWNEALFYYRSGFNLDRDTSSPSQFLAGEVCQLTMFQPGVLNEANQNYCEDYFSHLNDGNLMLNGGFEAESFVAWERHITADVAYKVERSEERPGPVASITGKTDRYHGGLFQRIAIPAGRTIRYSAWIKVRRDGAVRINPLYVRGQRGDELVVGAGKTISEDIDWMYLERIFQTSEVDGAVLNFYPVFFKGRGTIWIDDIRVTLLPDEK